MNNHTKRRTLMSDEFLYDEHGHVCEKNWSGHNEQRWDFWSQQPVRESCQRERNPSDYSDEGKPLFRGSAGSSVVSSSSSDGLLELLLSLFVMALIALAIPIIRLIFEKIVALFFQYFLKRVHNLISYCKLGCFAFRQLLVAGLLGLLSIFLIVPSNNHGGFLVVSGLFGNVNIYLVTSTMLKIKNSHHF